MAYFGLSSGIRPTGAKDVRGRQAVSVSLLDALIEQRPGLDRSTIDTDRADDTVLTILDPVAITDEHLFRWGGQTYRVKGVDGVVKSEVHRRPVQFGSDGDTIGALCEFQPSPGRCLKFSPDPPTSGFGSARCYAAATLQHGTVDEGEMADWEFHD